MKARTTIASMLVLSVFLRLHAAVLTGPVTNPANNHVYYLLTNESWTDSENEAISLGGHIVTISDAAEQGWVYTNFSNFGDVPRNLWLGLYRTNVPGGFAWSSGEPIS